MLTKEEKEELSLLTNLYSSVREYTITTEVTGNTNPTYASGGISTYYTGPTRVTQVITSSLKPLIEDKIKLLLERVN